MNLIPGFLIIIGLLVMSVIYLQLRLTFSPRQTVIMVPQSEQQTGCAAPALVMAVILLGIVLTVLFGPILAL